MAQNPTWNLALLGLALCFSRLVSSISPISIKGTKLYDNDGNQFFVKGLDPFLFPFNTYVLPTIALETRD